ncbi:hypothetical protein [Neobacillus sp. LXY-4]|uniref:hypothetical protein n=1 Tax=Neobacillus sp. LXY-4 TaxID=3379826 RepID=UPI003EE188AA
MIKKIILSFLAIILIPTLSGFASAESKIGVSMEYIVISSSQDGSTQIVDMVSYKNLTNEEYKGDGQSEGVLSVSLPEGASGLKMDDEKIKIKETESGFITTDSIPANGTFELSYSYLLEQGKDIALKFNYQADSFQILIPEGFGSVEIKDVEFSDLGLLDMGEQKFWGYSISNIKPDQTITVQYDKDKQPEGAGTQSSATENEDNANAGNVTREAPDFHNPGHIRMWEQSMLKDFDPHILMIVLGAILIAGVGYFTYFRIKNKANDKATDKEEEAFKMLMAKQKAILDKIIELEESLEQGQISENDYHAKLEAYKQHLVQVKLSLNQFVE